MRVSDTATESQSFAGVLDGATLRGVNLAQGKVDGYVRAAGLAGRLYGTVLVEDCTVDAAVAGDALTAGVVAGGDAGSSVTVRRCANLGSVTGTKDTAGIVATSNGAGATLRIEDCYNRGPVTGASSSSAGGVFGKVSNAMNGAVASIESSYSTGKLTGDVVAGVCAARGTAGQADSVAMANCAYDAQTSLGAAEADVAGLARVPGASAATTAQMKAWGAAYELNGGSGKVSELKTWRKARASENDGYPALCSSIESMDAAGSWSDVGEWVAVFGGSGAREALEAFDGGAKPFAIDSPEKLAWLSYQVNNGRLAADAQSAAVTAAAGLDLTGADYRASAFDPLEWVPVGTTSRNYTGAFDGAGKPVTNMLVSRSAYAGLFGYAYAPASFANVNVTGAISGAATRAGMVAGAARGASFKDCAVAGSIGGEAVVNAGGVVGEVFAASGAGSVAGCSSTVSVAGEIAAGGAARSMNLGGIVGFASSYAVSDCTASGNVTVGSAIADAPSTSAAGGIVGSAAGAGAAVERCAVPYGVEVTGILQAGGVAGVVGGSARLADCWSGADVSASGTAATGAGAGGVAGLVSATAAKSVANSFSYGTVKAAGVSAGGVAGSVPSASVVANCYYSLTKDPSAGKGVGNLSSSGAQGRADAYLQTPAFAFVLNAGRTDDAPWKHDRLTNHAYPFLGVPAQTTLDSWDYVGMLQDEDALRSQPVSEGSDLMALSGDGTSEDTAFVLSTPEAFAWWAFQINHDGAKKLTDAAGNATDVCYRSSFARLGGDMDLAGQPYGGTAEGGYANCLAWSPVGLSGNNAASGTDKAEEFSGSFDGAGHEVSNLYVPVGNAYNGLFGYVDGAVIRNVSVASGLVEGTSGAAGLVSYAVGYKTTTVTDCSNAAEVRQQGGQGWSTGGIMGCVYGRSSSVLSLVMERCSNTGAVWGPKDAGGIIGYVNSAQRSDTAAEIRDCFNRGDVTGGGDEDYSAAGGIAGRSYPSTTVIENCYDTGAVSHTGRYAKAGAIVGLLRSGGCTVANCWYSDGLENSSATGSAVADDELKTWGAAYQLNGGSGKVSGMGAWRMDAAGASAANDGYPVFCASTEKMDEAADWSDVGRWVDAFATGRQPSGDGSADGQPFQIETAEQLAWLGYKVNQGATDGLAAANQNASLSKSVSLAGLDYVYADAKGDGLAGCLKWVPVGKDTETAFHGDFAGNGNAVSDMRADVAGSGGGSVFAGLFGAVAGSSVSDLSVEGVVTARQNASKYAHAGMVAGYSAIDGERVPAFENVDTAGTVDAISGNDDCSPWVGGLVGWVAGGASFTGCYNRAAARSAGLGSTARGASGGIAGIVSPNRTVPIERSASNAVVSGYYAGGLVGKGNSSTNGFAASDCSVAGSVRGATCSGGIAGFAYTQDTVSNCYSRATLSGASSIGGVFGAGGSGSTMKRCLYLSGKGATAPSGTAGATGADCAGVPEAELKGRVDMAAAGAPVAGLGGTNAVDVLNTLDSGERTGAARVWHVAPEGRNAGFPDFEPAAASHAAAVDPDAATAEAPSTGLLTASLSGGATVAGATMLRPVRLLDGEGTADSPWAAPGYSLAAAGTVKENYALWAAGDAAGASADKKVALAAASGGADLSAYDGTDATSALGTLSGVGLYAAAAYNCLDARTALVEVADASGSVHEAQVAIAPVEAKVLDLEVQMQAAGADSFELAPDSYVHAGEDAAVAKEAAAVKNNGKLPVTGTLNGAEPQETVEHVKVPYASGDAVLEENVDQLTNGANAKLGLRAEAGSTPIDARYFDPVGTDPALYFTLGSLQEAKFRLFMEYSGIYTGSKGKFGYTLGYSFAAPETDLTASEKRYLSTSAASR